MIDKISSLSIKQKLLLTLIFPDATSLLFASVLLIVLEITGFQKNTGDDLSTLPAIIRLISSPIKKLVKAVKAISDTKDYSVRAVKVNKDELGVLVDAYNGLINTVEIQNQALKREKGRYLMLFDDNPAMVFNLKQRTFSLLHELGIGYAPGHVAGKPVPALLDELKRIKPIGASK